MPRHFARFLSTVFFSLLLGACAGNSPQWDPDDYTVKSGDTVYSIAWRYELDPEEFANWNQLGPAKLIRPGQRLHTRPPVGYRPDDNEARAVVYAPPSTRPQRMSGDRQATNSTERTTSKTSDKTASGKWVRARKGDTLYSISRRSGVSVARLAQLNQLKPPYIIQPGQTIFLQPLNTPRKQTGAKHTAPGASAKTGTTSTNTGGAITGGTTSYWPKSIRWQRPARGKVIKKFNRRQNNAKGIDIAGRPGDSVVAAADGKVVYSGNGLISYGNLVIIKHNKNYLSAYAYNRRLLVKEGEVIKAGQKIAEMGRKDNKTLLHFEIRKNGKPVDPLKYIPW